MDRPHTLLVTPEKVNSPPLNGLHGRIDSMTFDTLELVPQITGYESVYLVNVTQQSRVVEHLETIEAWQRTQYVLVLGNAFTCIQVQDQRLLLREAIDRILNAPQQEPLVCLPTEPLSKEMRMMLRLV